MNKVALARLEQLNQIKLTDAQREDILSFFAKRQDDVAFLEKIDTSNVEPMVQVMPTALSLREDAQEQPFSREELLAQAPATDAGYFCVPRVIE
ncbi:MAG: Asp-tRNA(Asn)/Glu-tRNA(Gln) amidotransferase subunit GatC [Clostridia bacterium]|nr:Asp-tRNA(Asn)/Glu-tRNA(Gln) amidotransferase subunit GatC [Clostridia bacterium]